MRFESGKWVDLGRYLRCCLVEYWLDLISWFVVEVLAVTGVWHIDLVNESATWCPPTVDSHKPQKVSHGKQLREWAGGGGEGLTSLLDNPVSGF